MNTKKTESLSFSGGAKAKEKQKAVIVSELRQKYPLKDLLQLSGLARSSFYHYLKHRNTDKYKREKQEILEIFSANKGRYGYRRVLMVLRNKGA